MPDQPGAPMEPLLDTPEAARLLGVSRRTLETWVRKKRIPFIKLGGGTGRGTLTRFRPDALREWLRAHEVTPEREAIAKESNHDA